MTTFMMDTTSSITMQSLGKIAQCAPAVGEKCGVCFYRQDAAKQQTASIKFTQCVSGQKSAFSPLQEKLRWIEK